MAIYRNGKKMKEIYRGETKIDKVYRGSNLIADYIERIISTGTNVKLLTSTGKKLENLFDEFKFYGWSKQASAPSVNSPQEIVSSGMGGTINIIERGNNILPRGDLMYYREAYTTDIIPWSGDTSMTLSGTVFTNNDEGEYHVFVDYLDADQKYLGTNGCSDKCGKTPTRFEQVFDGSYAGENSTHLDLKNDVKYIQLYFFIYNNTANEVSYNKLMLNVGNTALPYEVYQGCQLLTLQTPNGLPGIPVSSGGNYTDSAGQQWIADYIDLTRGKYVQRVWQKTFDGSDDEKWTRYDSDEGYEGFVIIALPEPMKSRVGLCNKFQIHTDWYKGVEGLWLGLPSGSNTTLYCKSSSFYDSSLDDKGIANFKANLAEHPMILMTYLDEPIERDLTTEEITEYKDLVTYDNVVTKISTNQNVTMSVKYPKRYNATI